MEPTLRLLRVGREVLVAATRVAHIVAKVVEPVLVVRTVRYVARIGMLAVRRRHIALNRADGQSERHIDRAHPLHVAAREVIVYRNDVDALSFERVQVGGQGRDERFTFARHHFRDLSFVERHAADHLNVVMTQPDRAPARFAADRKRLFQQVVERFAGGETFTEEDRLIAQIVVAHRLIRRLQLVDSGDARLNPLKFALV